MRIIANGELRAMTPEEKAERIAYESSPEYKLSQIQGLKEQLSASDYKAIKFAEGWITEEEYAPIRAARQALRDEINRLEETL